MTGSFPIKIVIASILAGCLPGCGTHVGNGKKEGNRGEDPQAAPNEINDGAGGDDSGPSDDQVAPGGASSPFPSPADDASKKSPWAGLGYNLDILLADDLPFVVDFLGFAAGVDLTWFVVDEEGERKEYLQLERAGDDYRLLNKDFLIGVFSGADEVFSHAAGVSSLDVENVSETARPGDPLAVGAESAYAMKVGAIEYSVSWVLASDGEMGLTVKRLDADPAVSWEAQFVIVKANTAP